MTYDQAVRYLLTLGRELASPQQARAAKFDLENIRALDRAPGASRTRVPFGAYRRDQRQRLDGGHAREHFARRRIARWAVHVAAPAANQRAHSPGRRRDFRCRFCRHVHRVHAVIEELLATGGLAAHPTFFECVTAMAFDFFARQKVDIAVFEVGMGGRLDSTNVIVPEVAVITQIDFDHENFLGHSIEEIAGEKAGIIKPGAWVVSAAGHPAAQEVIRRRAAEQNARLVEIESAYRVSRTSR